MSDWTAGYVADIDYTYGYYSELNPQRIKLAFLNQGLVFPEVGTACELGFGQGLSVNFHAAASLTEWHGTDFNPSQASFAQELGVITEAGPRLFDDAFAEFVNRSELPDFDYIGLHGIWSWISDDNRKVIVDFIRRKLKVGGVLYVSYNTLPGWAAFAPVRHLLTEHAEILGSEGRGIVSRIDGSLDFAEKLLETNPMFSQANPLVGDRLKQMKAHNRHYLAHEYFNLDWHPMHFATMAEWLGGAKVQYACPADYKQHIDAINLTEKQQAFLDDVPDIMFRETTRDFMVNQQFRKDYWVKGARKLAPLERMEALKAIRIVLVTDRGAVPLKVSGVIGEATLADTIYTPILDYVADHKIRTLGQIYSAVADKALTFAHVVQAAVLLTGAGHIELVQSDSVILKAKKRTDKLNAFLCQKARGSSEIGYLVSPVTGGAVGVNRLQKLFLLALEQGIKSPDDWASYAWDILSGQGDKLLKDGKPLDSAEDNITELKTQAQSFSKKQLSILKALQII